jgi:tetratricopeptide (TPR) repeat protein/serine/threonine protein kinase
MNITESTPNVIDVIAEEFVERYRRGERPAISEYEARYPEQAEAIRDLFPALVVMERLKPASRPVPTSDQAQCASEVASLGRLGDYRIVREVGRGGMGIVYEAVQESLGRKVALKVLPKQLVGDESRQARFEREARAAARLHHTNIVPVFGVGEESGLHYYAMQYIHGLGLDEVLRELRRLKSPGQEPSSAKNGSPLPVAEEPRQAVTITLTQALITGQFEAGANASESPPAVDLPSQPAGAGNGASDTAKERLSHTLRLSDSLTLPHAALSGKSGPDRGNFWQSVARMGVQVSEALHYAHEQGVLHRDVKPSNLLLDTRGTVWVTDFGLAKADDQQDLTQTGDVVGTLRYMAPEMFSDKADRRSDVYSLGLTLYELLALRPAFDEADRGRLIRLVLNESPPRLRTLDWQIPRDLETIVHKAIERDPSHRYSTAEELGSDLQRFLRDEPIRARPLSAVSRCARWCRRNPRTALLAAAIALLLVVVGIGGITWAIQAESARRRIAQAEAQRLDAEVNALVEEAQRLGEGPIADCERAVKLLTDAIGHRQEDGRLYLIRGSARYNLTVRRASARDYRQAVDDLELALRLRPQDLSILETLSRCLAEYSFLDADQRRALSRCRELLASWLALRPDEARALAILAQCELASDRPEAAAAVCRNAASAKVPARRALLFHLGWAYRELGQHELAVETLSEAIELNPRIIDEGQTLVSIYAARASSQLALGRRPQAEQDLKQALRVAPSQDWSFFDWYSVVSLLRKYGDYEQSLWWSEQFLRTAPECGPAWDLKGRLLADRKRRAEAAEHFLKAIELSPQYEGAYSDLTQAFFRAGEIEQAQQWSQRWLTAMPDSRAAHRWRGFLRFSVESYEEALSDLDRAIELGKHDAEAHYLRARVLVAMKQYDRATRDFDRSLQLNSTDDAAHMGRGRLHFSRGQFAEAASDFSQVLSRSPQNAEALRVRGDALRRLGRHAEALVDLDRAIQIDSHSATAYDRRGLVRAALGSHDLALADYARALEINPREPWTHRHVAEAHLAQKNYQAAAQCCDAWIGVDPASSEPHRFRALAHFSIGDRQTALEELAIAAQKNPQDADAMSLRGRVYAALGQHAKALADFNLALELRPGYDAIYYSRGLANAALRRFPAAVADFTRAISKHPRDGWLFYHRANAYRYLRRYEESLADVDRAVQCNEQNATFRMMQGRILATLGRFREAKDSFTRAFELDEGEFSVRHSVVTVLCLQKDYEAAKAYCASWIADEPHSADALRHRAYVDYVSGDYETALREFETALAQHPDDYLLLYYRGITHVALDDRQRGEADLDQSLQICPEENRAEHYGVVGEYFAESEKWKRAAECLAKSVELDPLDVRRAHLLALVQLAGGDEDGYQQTRLRILQRHALTEDPGAAELVALTGGLRKITSDGEPLIALANLAVENRPDSASCRCALASVLLRTGRAREALTQLEVAQRLANQPPAASTTMAAWASYVTVLAQQELGDSQAAAIEGEKAPAGFDAQPDDAWPSYIESPAWSRRLIAELLRREAAEKDHSREGDPK